MIDEAAPHDAPAVQSLSQAAAAAANNALPQPFRCCRVEHEVLDHYMKAYTVTNPAKTIRTREARNMESNDIRPAPQIPGLHVPKRKEGHKTDEDKTKGGKQENIICSTSNLRAGDSKIDDPDKRQANSSQCPAR